MTSPAARPTLQTVAEAAGVSRQTISNAIHRPERVRPGTLEVVRQAMSDLGYRPHLAARQLRTGRSGSIALRMRTVGADTEGTFMDGFVHALTESAQERDYRVVLFTADDDHDELRKLTELRDTANIDAVVLTDTHDDDRRPGAIRQAGIPVVAFGRPWAASGGTVEADHSWVDVDGGVGTAAATRHLHRLGHTRIAFLGWPDGSGTGDERREGWSRTLGELGLEGAGEHDGLDARCEDGVASGRVGMLGLAARAQPTAVVCASDTLALGAVQAARETGAPTAVVGFDNSTTARLLGLTTVAQPLTEIGRAIMESLVEQLDDPDARPRHQILDPHLVVRASSQAAADQVSPTPGR